MKTKKYIFQEYRVTSEDLDDCYIFALLINNYVFYNIQYYFVTDNKKLRKKYEKEYVKIINSIKVNE